MQTRSGAHPRPRYTRRDMAASEPKVSIVIPNRDGATPRDGLTYLEHGPGRRWREQSFRDFDVIVVDNGSPTARSHICGSTGPRSRSSSWARTRGFPAAVNRGIEAERRRSTSPCSTTTSSSHPTGSSCWSRSSTAIRARLRHRQDHAVRRSRCDRAGGHDFYTCGRFEPRGLDEQRRGTVRRTPRRRRSSPRPPRMYRREALERGRRLRRGLLPLLRGRGCLPADAARRLRRASTSRSRRRSTSGAGRSARPSELPRFFLVRNGLDHPAQGPAGLGAARSLPKIALYNWGTAERRRGETGTAGRVLQAFASFLRMVPATLRKRRAVQRAQEGGAGGLRGSRCEPTIRCRTRLGACSDERPPSHCSSSGARRLTARGLRADPRGATPEALPDRRRAAAG